MNSPASRTAVLPVARPHWIRAVAKFIPSEDDSWLLPATNEPCPEAQSCPAKMSKSRRNGNIGSARSGLLASRISRLTMPPYWPLVAQVGSNLASVAAAAM